MDRQKVTLLVLIDLSTAFDSIDHEIILGTLEKDFGVAGNAFKWLTSYLSERKQTILIKDHKSKVFNLQSGVQQGSCLGTRSQSAPVSDSQLQFQIESGARGMAFVFEWL
jgi:hypothetical protein